MTHRDILAEILKDSQYSFTLFDRSEIVNLRNRVFLKETKGQSKAYIKCLVRKKDILLKPEEIVRQLYLSLLHMHYNYSFDRIAVEHPVNFGREVKFADIVIFDIY